MLAGQSIHLGPVLGKDMPFLFLWRNDRKLAIASGPYRPMDEAVFTEWVAGTKLSLPRVLFVIRSNQTAEPIGYVEIYNIDMITRSAEFGICIGDAANRGRGFGREATRLALGFCWNDLHIQRLSLRVIGDNPAALALYRSVGFETEGRLRKAAFVDGGFQDVSVMAILRPEADQGARIPGVLQDAAA